MNRWTPREALDLLRYGNARFTADTLARPNMGPDRRKLTSTQGQSPFAVILGCSDSRVPVELIFDRGIGDLFVVRVAGNVLGVSELGSIEYAVDQLGTPLLVVLGHEKCGAVKAVLDGQEFRGNLRPLWDKVLPAVQEVKKTTVQPPERQRRPVGRDFAVDHEAMRSEEDRLLEEAVQANVWNSVEAALRGSESLRAKVIAEQVLVVGAYYHIVSARVDWMGTHPRQDRLLTAITR